MRDKQIIVLAAGKGTRMGVDMPKVLYPINGTPMVLSLVNTMLQMALARKPILVVGFQADEVMKVVGDRCDYVIQDKQLGTGHAVLSARDKLREFEGDILVLYGDHPLVSEQTINKLFNSHQSKEALVTMMTTKVADFDGWREGFAGYGRILRNEQGQVKAIREKIDCNDDELEIKEVNPSYFCFDSKWLWENIDKIGNDNGQEEFYLTDLIQIVVAQNVFINSIEIAPIECLGVNTKEQLGLIEKITNYE